MQGAPGTAAVTDRIAAVTDRIAAVTDRIAAVTDRIAARHAAECAVLMDMG